MHGKPTLSFGSYEIKKSLKGLSIAVGGAVIAYLAKEIVPMLKDTSYALLVPICSAGLNALKEWLVNNAPADHGQPAEHF